VVSPSGARSWLGPGGDRVAGMSTVRNMAGDVDEQWFGVRRVSQLGCRRRVGRPGPGLP
jgi:hypothetical protein